jgi:hypothetical protein
VTGVFVCIRTHPDGVTRFEAVRTHKRGTDLPPDPLVASSIGPLQFANRIVFFGADGGVWLVKDRFHQPGVLLLGVSNNDGMVIE